MELPSVMATLQLESKNEEGAVSSSGVEPEKEPAPVTPRLLRKRSYSGTALLKSLKIQRVQQNSPKKLNTDKEIMDYYVKVNKKWSVKQTNLETIFEEPKESTDGNVVTMSGSKVRRSIVFSGHVTKSKKVKRNVKVKKFQLTKGKSISEKKKKLSVDEVKLRLAESLDSWDTLFESND